MPQGEFNKKKTHCYRGHELTSGNVYVIPSTGGRQCRTCRDARKKEWQTRKLYGWTLEDRDAELVKQGNACALCGVTGLKWARGFAITWHTDHKHGKEGTHRGILCGSCNNALGVLEPHMDKVVAYLEKWRKING
jgi:hypothetical protein